MYADTMLFIIAIIGAVIFLISFICFVFFGKYSKQAAEEIRIRKEEIRKTITQTKDRATKKLNDSGITETVLLDEFEKENYSSKFACNTQIFERDYEILKEIHGGAMSRVFLVKDRNLGNEWILKYISSEYGTDITYEHERLKDFKNIVLPKIIRKYEDSSGVYLVETYIDGVALSDISHIDENNKSYIKSIFTRESLIKYMIQLAEVYEYLHNLEQPIYHLDIKPSNIMLTPNELLVPIDFGISRSNNNIKGAVYATPEYAAPEQLTPNSLLDSRTDIYGIGALFFELSTGERYNESGAEPLNKSGISKEFARIILKCLNQSQKERYQTMSELLIDLNKIIGKESGKFAKSVIIRRIAAIAAVFAFVLTGSSFTGGYYIYNRENLSVVGAKPQYLNISLQQSSDLQLEKILPNGEIVNLRANDFKWEYKKGTNNIAQIDGNRISGLNLGTTEIQGKYRNKLINLIVNVVEPLDNGETDIIQQFELGRNVSLFAGNQERDYIDGDINNASFVSPGSMCLGNNGEIYIADSTELRVISSNGKVSTIELDEFYITPKLLRFYNNNLYMLSNEWQDFEDGEYKYSIVKVKLDNNITGEIEFIYNGEAPYTSIEDFQVININGEDFIYFIENNSVLGETYIKSLSLINNSDINKICKLDNNSGACSIDFGDNNEIYIANKENATIQIYYNDELSYLSGIQGEKAFIDGFAPRFYSPQKIKYYNGDLYVWDFNTLRKIYLKDGHCVSIAGEASPEFDLKDLSSNSAEEIILAYSLDTDFIITEQAIIITEPKKSIIREINPMFFD